MFSSTRNVAPLTLTYASYPDHLLSPTPIYAHRLKPPTPTYFILSWGLLSLFPTYSRFRSIYSHSRDFYAASGRAGSSPRSLASRRRSFCSAFRTSSTVDIPGTPNRLMEEMSIACAHKTLKATRRHFVWFRTQIFWAGVTTAWR